MKRFTFHKPELVVPAGDWPSLITAAENGADSIYFGIQGLNMRERASNFKISDLKKIMRLLHQKKVKGYLALNVVVMNDELKRVERVLLKAKESNVDAVIAWDMAVISLAKRIGLKIHLSTQASISNIEAIKYYNRLGIKRVVLARECSLSDMRKIKVLIKKENLDTQIETFIHGAMCVSISGRCFLSEHSYGESANRGRCLQPCRREFIIKERQGDLEYILGKDYILSPKDLCTIDFIDSLIRAEIDAFKIEGRMRSPEYIKIVVSVYREAIDAFYENRLSESLKRRLKKELKSVYNRGFSDGFYFKSPDGDISKRLEHLYEKIYLGEVKKFYPKISVAEILVQAGPLKKDDELLFVGKSTPVQFVKASEIQQEHKYVTRVKKGELAGIKVPFKVRLGDKVYAWRKK
ncbi:MAG: peptidase U32 family protein [Candidatus Kaelpia aquatica]|nr:peptidase U32 family protein [Candidatus Kaelpia aquatica]